MGLGNACLTQGQLSAILHLTGTKLKKLSASRLTALSMEQPQHTLAILCLGANVLPLSQRPCFCATIGAGLAALRDLTANLDVLRLRRNHLILSYSEPTFVDASSCCFPSLQAQDRAALRDLTANLNDRHRNAQFAGRASVELHTLIFFKMRAIAADARIVKV